MSLEGTVVPGGLRSELCLWGVKSWDSLSFLNQFFYIKKSEKITFSQIFWHMHLNNRTALESEISRCNNSRITCSISKKLVQNIFSNIDFENLHSIWSYNVVISFREFSRIVWKSNNFWWHHFRSIMIRWIRWAYQFSHRKNLEDS